MAVEFGYAGRILKVDLTSGVIEEISSFDYLPEYFGGRGLLAKLYWDFVPADIEAFDPRNCLIFTTGPLTGTGASQTATGICGSKAPMFRTPSYYVSTCAGAWPFEMKYAGYDAFIITGASPKPAYLWVNDGHAEIRDAAFLRGRTTRHTHEELRKIHGKKAQVACIGPAGENKVIIATIATDSNTGFSQAGHGAVMGAKNLKAIVVRGSGSIKVHDPLKIIEINEAARRIVSAKDGEVRVVRGEERPVLRNPSASFYVDKVYPTDPNTQTKMDVRLGVVKQRVGACPGCNVGCKTKRMYVDNSLPTGVADCGVALDWITAERHFYGGRIDNKLNWEFAMLNDDLGLDMFATGASHFSLPFDDVAHAPSYASGLDMWYQAYAEGILTEENTGLPWSKFGSREFMIDWLHNITYRIGFGDILANGQLSAIDHVAEHEEFGPNRARMKTMGEKYFPKAGVFTGMNRHQMFDYGLGYFGVPGQPHAKPNSLCTLYCATGVKRGKEPNVLMNAGSSGIVQKYYDTDKLWGGISYWEPDLAKAAARQDLIAMKADCMARCDFNNWPNFRFDVADEFFSYSLHATIEYMSAVFGKEYTDEEIDVAMEMLVNLERAIWLREGYLNGPVDTFFDCIFEEKNEEGVTLIPRAEFEQALQNYYVERRWTNGVPKRETLESLDLKYIADALEDEYGIALPA
jgi:aldehyde:ferredoxin oxidoreductase